jgi:hypothetical protein
MRHDADPMRDLDILFLHLITTVTRLFGPGGARSIDVNTPPAKAGGFGLRLKAGLIGPSAD